VQSDAENLASPPPSGTGRGALVAALVTAAATVLVVRLGSGHTIEGRRFAGRPEFLVWTWALAATVAAAAATAFAVWPTFRRLARLTGRRAVSGAIAVWAAVGGLAMLGPAPLGAVGQAHLWLLRPRLAAATLVVGVFITPSFASLRLAQARLSVLGRETASSAGRVICELLWLRMVLQRSLITFAVVITGAVLAAGALRNALLADHAPAEDLPVIGILAYGGFFTLISAAAFVPAYLSWQDRVSTLRDQLHPVPDDGLPPRDWHQARADYDTLLNARSNAAAIFTAAFGVLAPLAGSLVTTLIPTS